MLKSSKIVYNCIFQTIIRCYNWIFLISVVLFFVFYLFVYLFSLFLFCCCCCCCCLGFSELESTEGWFLLKVHLFVWVVAGHELDTLSIQAQIFHSWLIAQLFTYFVNIRWSFLSMIKQVHNALTVHDNSWALKLDNFSEFQNFISDNPHPVHSKRHYDALRKKMDMWLTD